MRIRKIIIVSFLVVSCLLFCSCRMGWGFGYIPFVPEGRSPSAYLADADCAFFRLGDVAIMPDLKPLNDTEYRFGFYVYAKDRIDEVSVENICLCNSSGEIPLDKTELFFAVSEEREDLYYGSGRLCTIQQDILHPVRGEAFTLTIRVSVKDKDGITQQKNIEYAATAYQDWGWYWP